MLNQNLTTPSPKKPVRDERDTTESDSKQKMMALRNWTENSSWIRNPVFATSQCIYQNSQNRSLTVNKKSVYLDIQGVMGTHQFNVLHH